MTNKQIASKVANIVFERKDGSPDSEAFAVQLLIETLNNPTKYSDGVCYSKENMEQAVLDILKDKRFNGIHFMDLSEPMNR